MSKKLLDIRTKRTAKKTPNQSIASKPSNNASVFLRIRAKVSAQYEVEQNIFRLLHSKSNNISKNFTFTNIFGHEATQRQVYSVCVEKAIDKEENLTVLTYGASNSGKTFTLVGNEIHNGIIPRAMEQIFSRYKGNVSSTPTLKIVKGEWSILDDEVFEKDLNNRELFFSKPKSSVSSSKKNDLRQHHVSNGTASNMIAYIWISFFEIYNENVVDLLELGSKKGLKKQSNLTVVANGGNAYISGLASVLVTNCDEAWILLKIGVKARQNASTSINPHSSRSHCIFVVDVIQQDQSNGMVIHTSYKFCDLAGSERLKKSQAEGARCQEAKNINNSLLVLGRCLNSIHNNQKLKTKDIVPFRDSKLTLYLQTSLTGNEKLAFIVHILPSLEFHEENEQVLRFASIAKEIVHHKPIKEIVSRRSTFSKFLLQADSDLLVSNIPKSLNFPHVQLILNENDKLKKKVSFLEAELMKAYEDIEQKTRERDNFQRDQLQKNIDVENQHHEQLETNDNDPIYANSSNVYKVEEILDHRSKKGKIEYLVKWSPTWESRKDVTNDVIEEYKNRKAGPVSIHIEI